MIYYISQGSLQPVLALPPCYTPPMREDEIPFLIFLVIALVLVVSDRGCRPKDQSMLVVYVQGDVYLPSLTVARWDFDQTLRCHIIDHSSDDQHFFDKTDSQENVLLCGETTERAWSNMWLKPGIKGQLLEASVGQLVTFRSAGRRTRGPSWWSCRRTTDGIACD